jgi:hypothetical protein
VENYNENALLVYFNETLKKMLFYVPGDLKCHFMSLWTKRDT